MHKALLLDEFMFWLDLQDEDELRVIVCETMSKTNPEPAPAPFIFRTHHTPASVLHDFADRMLSGLPIAMGAIH
jgi:hypothetical protein